MTRALTRGIADRYAEALRADSSVAIDVARARAQHAAYVAGLRDLGLEVTALPADERFADGCFVEDTAVLAGGVALITCPGAPSRREEVESVAAALAGWRPIERMTHPACLDGGDCLLAGKRLYIGLSARTNAAGVARAREVFGKAGLEVIGVPLPKGVLHLKSICSPLGDGRVVLADGWLPSGALGPTPLVTTPRSETYGANCLAFGGAALVSSGFPAVHDALSAAGLRLVPLETTEVRKADGALTCLSLIES